MSVGSAVTSLALMLVAAAGWGLAVALAPGGADAGWDTPAHPPRSASASAIAAAACSGRTVGVIVALLYLVWSTFVRRGRMLSATPGTELALKKGEQLLQVVKAGLLLTQTFVEALN
jgi:hypothetical protein